MQIILSHNNTDFDALASMIAAKKLYPDAVLVLPDKQDHKVGRFLNIYRDTFQFMRDLHVEWDQVEQIILVDVANLKRAGRVPADFDPSSVEMIVYDHHPKRPEDVQPNGGRIEEVGAAVTLLIEEIERQKLPISEFEATLFGLGIYTDTGNFTYKNTTARDLEVTSTLVRAGMNLEMVQRFSEDVLEPEQQILLDELLQNAETIELEGLEIVVSSYDQPKFQSGLALITHKLLGIKGADAAISIVRMKKHVHIVGRANSNRISLHPILQKFGGGGHQHAGSAMVKKGDLQQTVEAVLTDLPLMLNPAVTAAEIMSSPVKTLTPETTIEEAGRLMYRYGHSGYPIVSEDGKLVGLITRRDLDKGNYHGLGHAPVKGYMTTDVFTVTPETPLEEVQKLVIDHNIGRLPVLDVDGQMIGIVTRTNLIEKMHQEMMQSTEDETHQAFINIQNEMTEQLPKSIMEVLQQISETASEMAVDCFLIGGIVRDILLEKPNDDIDIVVEGDGVQFAKRLHEKYGGEVVIHESFGTATWEQPDGLSIDVTSSRLEFYDRPASLPSVELSTLEEDLRRRDFTINAMAARLNEGQFGELIDPFGGQNDLQKGQIKVLHNLSFIEDPTRICRAVRFEQRFDFKMDAETEQFALNSIDHVKSLTPNRLVVQMEKLFHEGDPSAVIRRLFEIKFWQQFGVEEQVAEQTVEAAKRLQQLYEVFGPMDGKVVTRFIPNWFDYFILPFMNSGELTSAYSFALTKPLIKQVEELQALLKAEPFAERTIEQYHLRLKHLSTEAILIGVASGRLDDDPTLRVYLEKRAQLPTYVTGQTLMGLGLKPGPKFKEFLLRLEIEQLNGDVTSLEEALTWVKEKIHERVASED